MIRAKLEIQNHTRDYFADEYVDTFELIPQEQNDEFVFEAPLRSNLNKKQLLELISYLQKMVES